MKSWEPRMLVRFGWLCIALVASCPAVEVIDEVISERRVFPGETSIVLRDIQMDRHADVALNAAQKATLSGESSMQDEAHMGPGVFLGRSWLLRTPETGDIPLAGMWANGANAGSGLRAERRIVVTSATAVQIALRGTPGHEVLLATTGHLTLMPAHQRTSIARVGSDGRVVIDGEIGYPQARGAVVAQDRTTQQRVVVEVSRE